MRRPRPISPRIHGVLDYTTSAAVAAAPRAMNFPKPARVLFESLAAGYTGLSTVTDYPLMTVALRLNAGVQNGQVFPVSLNPSTSYWQDLLGTTIPVELQPGSNDLLVSDVIRTGELQAWFLAEHLVDTPLVRA